MVSYKCSNSNAIVSVYDDSITFEGDSSTSLSGRGLSGKEGINNTNAFNYQSSNTSSKNGMCVAGICRLRTCDTFTIHPSNMPQDVTFKTVRDDVLATILECGEIDVGGYRFNFDE